MSELPPLTAAELRELARVHGSWVKVAEATGRKVSQIRSRASSFGIKLNDCLDEGSGPTESITSDTPSEWGDIRRLIESRGLDPDDWIVARARVNEWGDNQQLRVDLEPVTGVALPARTGGWVAPDPKPKSKQTHELVCFLSDQHVPFHDQDLHIAVCQWLKDEQPDRVVLLGDLVDYDQVSRYERNPDHTATMQDTLDAAYALLRDYRSSAPNAKFQMVAGNHEERLRSAIIKNLGALYGIRRGGANEPSVLSTEYLLRLDELKIEYVDSGVGGYEHNSVKVSDELQAIHGWISRKGAAASAAATLDHLRVSTIQGHSHRAGLTFKTQWTIDNDPRTLLAAETGTLAQIRDGLSHAARPDWSNGFATAEVWDDGLFNIDLALWVGDSLMWRGKRWR